MNDSFFINLADKRHTWAFGAITELIYNSSDAETMPKPLRARVATFNASGAKDALHVLEGLCPSPTPKRLASSLGALCLADAVDQVQGVDRARRNRNGTVADPPTLLERLESDRFLLQIDARGCEDQRLTDPAARVRQHEAQRTDLCALLATGLVDEAVQLVSAQVLALTIRSKQFP